MTKTEFEILRLLLENEGRVFSRAEILRRIWNNDAEVLDRTVDVNITRLRKNSTDTESLSSPVWVTDIVSIPL